MTLVPIGRSLQLDLKPSQRQLSHSHFLIPDRLPITPTKIPTQASSIAPAS